MAAKIVITGNLTRDPEMKTLGSQQACVFSVAVRTRMKKDDGTYESNFYDCTYFGKMGEYFMNKAQKGTGVTVIGELAQTSYNGKDGKIHNVLRVTVDTAEAQSRLKGTRSDVGSGQATQSVDNTLPF